MTRSIKNPKRPQTDDAGNAVRHIPRSVYNTVPIDALLKYLYRYNFHWFCTEFRVYIGKNKYTFKASEYKGMSIIFETVSLLVAEYTYEDSKGNLSSDGIPILNEGFVCHYNAKDIEDPYFKCSIYLDSDRKPAQKVKIKANEVINVSS